MCMVESELAPPCVCPGYEPLAPPLPPAATAVPVWQDRTIASSKLRLLEYSAFMEVPQDQDSVSGPERYLESWGISVLAN